MGPSLYGVLRAELHLAPMTDSDAEGLGRAVALLGGLSVDRPDRLGGAGLRALAATVRALKRAGRKKSGSSPAAAQREESAMQGPREIVCET